MHHNLLYYKLRGLNMAIKLSVTSKEILENKFKVSPRGYDPFDVDQFLDKILKDYRVIESNYLVASKEIDALKNQIKQLEEEKKQLEIENAKYAKKFEGIIDNKNVTIDNIDLMKRISRLEKFIYNKGFDPKTIK